MSKADLSKRVMRSIAIDHGVPKLERDLSGNAPIVIALPNEYIADVFERAKRVTSDGVVNIIIASTNQYEVLRFNGSIATDVDLEVNGELSMGMLSIRLAMNPGKSIRVNLRDSSVDVPNAAVFEYA